MPRREGEVFFFGTAMGDLLKTPALQAPNHRTLREAGLIEEAIR
jgi:hypothetical protein